MPPLGVPARTLRAPATFSGVGLFTPGKASITVRPAAPGHGIVFRRIDLPGRPAIPARAERTIARERQTVLAAAPGASGRVGVSVQTVEHLLSALNALGVTDALIDLAGAEVPLLDGSARDFAQGLLGAGLVAAGGGNAPAEARVMAPICFAENGGAIEAHPLPDDGTGPRLEVEYRLDYGAAYPNLRGVASFTLRYGAPDVQGAAR